VCSGKGGQVIDGASLIRHAGARNTRWSPPLHPLCRPIQPDHLLCGRSLGGVLRKQAVQH
jgi:hypothetical protein